MTYAIRCDVCCADPNVNYVIVESEFPGIDDVIQVHQQDNPGHTVQQIREWPFDDRSVYGKPAAAVPDMERR